MYKMCQKAFLVICFFLTGQVLEAKKLSSISFAGVINKGLFGLGKEVFCGPQSWSECHNGEVVEYYLIGYLHAHGQIGLPIEVTAEGKIVRPLEVTNGAVDFLQEHFSNILQNETNKNESIQDRIAKAFLLVDQKFLEKDDRSGASFTIFVVQEYADGRRYAYSAHVGDLEAEIFITEPASEKIEKEWRTPKHTLANPNEKVRVEKAGASVGFIGITPCIYNLGFTRSVGDKPVKTINPSAVIANPTIEKFDLTGKDAVLMMASDFVWFLSDKTEFLKERVPTLKKILHGVAHVVPTNISWKQKIWNFITRRKEIKDLVIQNNATLLKIARKISNDAAMGSFDNTSVLLVYITAKTV